MKPTRLNRLKLWWHCLIKGHEDMFCTTDGKIKDILCFDCTYGDIGYKDTFSHIDKTYRGLVEKAVRYDKNFDIPN